MDVAGVLARVAPFSALERPVLERMALGSRVVRLAPHEVFLRDGETPRHACILVEGCLTRSLLNAEGKSLLLNYTRPVTAFCCAAALAQSAHIGMVEAREPSGVVAVPVDLVLREFEESPAFARAMARNLARSSVRQTEAIREFMFPVPVRLARLLCRLADDAESVELEMGKASMAEMLATVPETLSRALKTLRDAGLIDVDGRRVHIADPHGLRAYARE